MVVRKQGTLQMGTNARDQKSRGCLVIYTVQTNQSLMSLHDEKALSEQHPKL
jgi:hypothetical protein